MAEKRKALKKKRKRHKRWMKCLWFILAALLIIVITRDEDTPVDGKPAAGIVGTNDTIREELKELLSKNEEAADFVKGYSDRQVYVNQPINIKDDCEEGQVPLLMQWDKRWGYDAYGDSIIGLAGCGPTCLAMAYLYFTGDTEENPRTMAQFADENGYHTLEGTSWSLWTDGVKELGMTGEVLPLDENRMKTVLDQGGVIVCSMRPGDFTTTGHFILIRGYDDEGFWVNDPNRRSNSEKQWTYETLSGQIKNLWGIWQ